MWLILTGPESFIGVKLNQSLLETFTHVGQGFDDCLWSGPLGFNSWASIAPAFQYRSCFISVMNLDLYVCCFGALMSRGHSRGPNNF